MILATIHGLAYRIIPGRIPSNSVKSLEKGLLFILEHADYLVAVSETTKNELISEVGVAANRIYVVSHGVDKKFGKIDNPKAVFWRLKKNYNLHRPYILYVGAIGLHKNIMGILAAYQKLSSNVPYDLVMAGPPDSAWDKAHQFVKRHKLSKRVYFLGHIYEPEHLIDLYNGADLFVFPSFYEGWTSPPMEAMACGTPVIASNSSSLPETLGGAAVLIDPDDPVELALMMEKVLFDKELQSELIQKGFKHVALHTWEKAAKNLKEIFADIHARGPWKGNG